MGLRYKTILICDACAAQVEDPITFITLELRHTPNYYRTGQTGISVNGGGSSGGVVYWQQYQHGSSTPNSIQHQLCSACSGEIGEILSRASRQQAANKV